MAGRRRAQPGDRPLAGLRPQPLSRDDTADERPFLYEGTIDGRIAPKERVVTLGEGADAIAFAWSDLAQTGLATATVAGEPVVVLWEPGTVSALDEALIDESADVGSAGRLPAGGRRPGC